MGPAVEGTWPSYVQPESGPASDNGGRRLGTEAQIADTDPGVEWGAAGQMEGVDKEVPG